MAFRQVDVVKYVNHFLYSAVLVEVGDRAMILEMA
jgi:hypothetical protein